MKILFLLLIIFLMGNPVGLAYEIGKTTPSISLPEFKEGSVLDFISTFITTLNNMISQTFSTTPLFSIPQSGSLPNIQIGSGGDILSQLPNMLFRILFWSADMLENILRQLIASIPH